MLEFAHRTELVELHVLIGADNAGHHSVAEIRRTWQAAACADCVRHQFSVKGFATAYPAFQASIQTYILAGGVVAVVPGGQVSLVLGRPARGAGEGTGHHDGGGLGGPAHGADGVMSVMIANIEVLCTVEEGVV